VIIHYIYKVASVGFCVFLGCILLENDGEKSSHVSQKNSKRASKKPKSNL